MWGKKRLKILSICLKYDFKTGSKFVRNFYVVWLIFFLLLCIDYCMEMSALLESKGLCTKVGILDQWIYIFRGQIPAIHNDRRFLPNAAWMIVQMLPLYSVLLYPTSDLSKGGANILLRLRSRRIWWTSKFIWGITQVTLYYLLLFVVCVLVTSAQGEFAWLNSSAIEMFLDVTFSKENISHLWTLGLPLLSAYAHVSIELFFSVLVSPFFSMGVIWIMNICAAYYQNPFLVGNAAAFLRNNIVVANGIDTEQISFICLMFVIVFYCVGNRLIRFRDVI